MPYSHATYEEKPYNRCIDCRFIGVKCDGPDFLAMSIPRLCEWARLRKSFLLTRDKKWTNAYIAEQADVSKTTVDRFLAGDMDDIRFTTAASIIKVLIDGTWGQYPCTMAADESEDKDCATYKALLEEEQKKVAYLKKELEFGKEQLREKDKLLAERRDYIKRKDKWIAILAICFGICLAAILGFLIMDYMNRDWGMFWRASAVAMRSML